MGAVFSFMSTVLQKFLDTQTNTPILISCYIDDIFLIWLGTIQELTAFLTNLNTFHPNLQFIHHHSTSTIDFLDLTIYKGTGLHFILDTETFQMSLNLYQYPHFSSYHARNTFKAIIKGECIHYARTNTAQKTYATSILTFKRHLRKQNYPDDFINKIT